ncbi:hypothetical protein GQ53DRAFT_419860 [Thozetella sp. PMI_491]|nr:hypothetical protein GQ53DRAFT_419860 [Thozetella sp. PMI_491]
MHARDLPSIQAPGTHHPHPVRNKESRETIETGERYRVSGRILRYSGENHDAVAFVSLLFFSSTPLDNVAFATRVSAAAPRAGRPTLAGVVAVDGPALFPAEGYVTIYLWSPVRSTSGSTGWYVPPRIYVSTYLRIYIFIYSASSTICCEGGWPPHLCRSAGPTVTALGPSGLWGFGRGGAGWPLGLVLWLFFGSVVVGELSLRVPAPNLAPPHPPRGVSAGAQ